MAASLVEVFRTGQRNRREAVVHERRDDLFLDNHQRQRLPASIVDRHQQMMRRGMDGLGERFETVRLDGRCNSLSNLVARRDVALGGHGGQLAISHVCEKVGLACARRGAGR